MNTTISFAIPVKEAKRTRQLARQRGFRSVSQYMRFLVTSETDTDLITEEEILRRSKDAKRLYEEGKLIEAASLSEYLSHVKS